MRSKPKQGVPPGEHPAKVPADWNGARVFLEVVRAGSFRSAAERLGQSTNVVRRHVSTFERQIGTVLFTRDVHGAHLTEEGAKVAEAAEQMEAAAFGIMRTRDTVSAANAGEVRIAVTEGLGTFWLAPRIAQFQSHFPNVRLDLHCGTTSVDLLRQEADIAIQLSRPTTGDLKISKLGRLHIVPFATAHYLKAHGHPRSYAELPKHRFIIQAPDRRVANEICGTVFPGVDPNTIVAIRTNVASANYWAVARGAGIGFLPTYAYALDSALVPLDVGIRTSFDIWLSYHPAANGIARVRNMLDWLIDSFSWRNFPWFSDEFIHPLQFPPLDPGSLAHFFAGVPDIHNRAGSATERKE